MELRVLLMFSLEEIDKKGSLMSVEPESVDGEN